MPTNSNVRTGSDGLFLTSGIGFCAAHNTKTSSAISKLNPYGEPFITTTYCAPNFSGARFVDIQDAGVTPNVTLQSNTSPVSPYALSSGTDCNGYG